MSEIKIYDAIVLAEDDWRQLQAISRDAFAATLDRSQDEIDTLVEWRDPARFRASHEDPNSEVGRRYNPDQSYSKPMVAIATEAGEPVGFAYSAHNVSGATEHDRMIKRLSIVRNYLWLREVAVAPAYQHQGIATELGRALLKDAISLQPPTAYIWPDEIRFLQEALEWRGFSATREQQVTLFGEGSTPVRQVRMQAPSSRGVLSKM